MLTLASSDERSVTPADESAPAEGVDRIARLLETLDLDCRCRERLRHALTAFQDLETRRRERRALDRAFQSRAEILALVLLLDDLEAVSEPALDPTVCREMAEVFDEVASAARLGATALRSLSETTCRP